jgi:hypothetical protein
MNGIDRMVRSNVWSCTRIADVRPQIVASITWPGLGGQRRIVDPVGRASGGNGATGPAVGSTWSSGGRRECIKSWSRRPRAGMDSS